LITRSCEPPVAVNDTRTVPLLPAALEFAATLKVTVPVPLPEVLPVAMMNESSDVADQPHPAAVVTVTLRPPPLGMKFVGFADAEYEHGATEAAAWLTSKMAPPPLVPVSVSRAVRAGPLLEATVNPTCKEPVPLLTDGVRKDWLLESVQPQAGCTDTLMLPCPPPAPKLVVPFSRAYVHVTGASICTGN
jgi:hypothetical protein